LLGGLAERVRAEARRDERLRRPNYPLRKTSVGYAAAELKRIKPMKRKAA
jgi:hypothetical protein